MYIEGSHIRLGFGIWGDIVRSLHQGALQNNIRLTVLRPPYSRFLPGFYMLALRLEGLGFYEDLNWV